MSLRSAPVQRPPARRWRTWPRVLGGLAAVLAVLVVGLASQAGRIRAGAEAYLYGFPLVITELTRAEAARALGTENTLLRVRRFPDARFRGVVRPNVDTLYTTAFIDTALGPWLFEMPPNAERYELMPFMDAWTNVFAAPGTRTTGTAGGRFLLVGPGWQGSVPPGLQLLRSPTRTVWLIGRTQTNGAADYPQVHRLQDGLTLTRVGAEATAASSPAAPPTPSAPGSTPSSTPASTPPSAPPSQPPPQPLRPGGPTPLEQLRALDTEAYFTRLAALMVDNPPAAADGPMLARMAGLGIVPGRPLQWGWLDHGSAALGRWIADRRVRAALAAPRERVRGWATPPAHLGDYGTDYATRAAVAMVGLGANLPADALYPSASVDGQGEPLHGRHRYRIRFEPGQLPPVRAFWSITAYGADDYLIDHPAGRHALGDRDPLRLGPDGSLELWVQADEPAPERRANWLPVRADAPFTLTARLYWPRPETLSGAWSMPAVERLPDTGAPAP
jgi:hypothetical protein